MEDINLGSSKRYGGSAENIYMYKGKIKIDRKQEKPYAIEISNIGLLLRFRLGE